MTSKPNPPRLLLCAPVDNRNGPPGDRRTSHRPRFPKPFEVLVGKSSPERRGTLEAWEKWGRGDVLVLPGGRPDDDPILRRGGLEQVEDGGFSAARGMDADGDRVEVLVAGRIEDRLNHRVEAKEIFEGGCIIEPQR